MIWQIKCSKIVILKSNPVSHCQTLARPSKHSDTERMLIWQPAPMLKACVNIAPKSKLSHIHSPSIAATCVILWNQDFDICLFKKAVFTCILYCAVPSYWKNFGFAWDEVEVCHFLHITACQMLPGRSYLIIWG